MYIVNDLQNNFAVNLHSEINCYPSDVDICIRPEDVHGIKALLFRHKATLIEERGGVLKHAVYVNSRLYILDIKYNFSVYFMHLSSVRLSEKGTDQLRKSEILHKVFKYLCQNRKDKYDYINFNRVIFTEFLKDDTNFEFLSKELANNGLKCSTECLFDLFQSRKLSHGSKGFLFSYLFLFKEYIRCKYPLGIGKSIAFIGPDGSGKSFYINNLYYPKRKINTYMGDWFFKFQPLYNKMMRLGSPYNRFVYFFYFIENTLRSSVVGFYKMLGFYVFIDRFPGTNRNVVKKGVLGLLNKFSYKLISKPNKMVLLYAPPEVIYSRKQELTVDEIKEIQISIKSLVNKRLTVIETEDADAALNKILNLIYS